MSLVDEKDKWRKAGEDLVESDSSLLEYLSDVHFNIVQHLVNHDEVDGRCQMQVTQLAQLNEKFQALCGHTGEMCNRLQGVLNQGGTLSREDMYLIHHVETVQELYTQYFSFFTNLVVIGGFDYIAKKTSNYWKENKESLGRFLCAQKTESSVTTSLFRILHERLREQITLYILTLSTLAKDSQQIADVLLDEALRGFTDLSSCISQALDDANITKDLWKSLGKKLTEALCTPERRLREDSKNISLSVSTGRFGHDRILLFDDILVHLQGFDVHCYDLTTVWIEVMQVDNSNRQLLKIITPEEQLIFHTQEPEHQVVWHWKLSQAVRQCLDKRRDFPLWGKGNRGLKPETPPERRFAAYVYQNDGRLKSAEYEGDWKQGRPHGKGTLKWEDGRNYTGDFENGLEHGFGVYLIPQSDTQGYDCYKCHWSEGRKERYGICEYSTNIVYKGYFKGDVRHGFGVLESSRGESTLFRYVGHWNNDKKHGYGVMEKTDSGELYIGMWKDDQREGSGIVVTQSGLAYEGIFQGDKLTGKGVLVSEDNLLYEGEFTEDLTVKGKGKITFPDGTTIEGVFNSKFGNGLQAYGILKASSNADSADVAAHLQLGLAGLPVLERWPGIFCPFVEYLCSGSTETEEAFLGFHMESGRSLRKMASGRLASPGPMPHVSCSGVSRRTEDLPVTNTEFLKDLRQQESKEQLQQYLEKSLQSSRHPLGKLLQTQLLTFQMTYSGIGANKHLLKMAQEEVKYHAEKILDIVMDYVPQLFNKNSETIESRLQMSSHSLVLPVILPDFYPELHMLYMLHHETDDALYWQGILHLGLLPDTKLLEFLDVQRHLWPLKDLQLTSNQRYSLVQDQCFLSAIECVQKISTTADPQEKLTTLFHTLTEIERTVSKVLMRDYRLPMDDLLPLLIYVISRARIRHLGAELHFIRDMMDPEGEGGIIDFLLTALESCYQHVQKEEIRRGRFTDFI